MMASSNSSINLPTLASTNDTSDMLLSLSQSSNLPSTNNYSHSLILSSPMQSPTATHYQHDLSIISSIQPLISSLNLVFENKKRITKEQFFSLLSKHNPQASSQTQFIMQKINLLVNSAQSRNKLNAKQFIDDCHLIAAMKAQFNALPHNILQSIVYWMGYADE